MAFEERFPLPFQQRPLRFSQTGTDALAVSRQELKRQMSAQRDQTDQLLATLAVAQFQLHQIRRDLPTDVDVSNTAEALEIVASDLAEVLSGQKVEAIDLTDGPWTAEQRKDNDLRGHQINEALTEPRVTHTVTPPVYRRGRLIARGAVIVETPRRE